MNRNVRIRRAHRWLGIAFAASIVLVFVVLAVSGPDWLVYLPLLPLALLFLTGAYLYLTWFRGPHRAAAHTPSGWWVRPTHRWSALIFTATVLVTFVALSLPDPIEWVSYIPLFPLLALLITGLTMAVRARRKPSPAQP
ncbi:hypothetical protein ACWDOP_36640 [Nocardia sp. NPDC003693]